MKIIALAQQKGGVGKSSLAIHMAVELTKRGHATVIVDLDPQASVLKWAARRGDKPPRAIACEPTQLQARLIAFNSEGMDYVILDLPGRRAPTVNEGIKASDFVIVPSRPLDMDIEASGETVAIAQRLQRRYAFAMNIVPPRGSRTKEFAAAIVEHGHPVLPAFITDRLAFPDAVSEGKGVSEFDPKGKAAEEIANFTTAVERALDDR